MTPTKFHLITLDLARQATKDLEGSVERTEGDGMAVMGDCDSVCRQLKWVEDAVEGCSEWP